MVLRYIIIQERPTVVLFFPLGHHHYYYYYIVRWVYVRVTLIISILTFCLVTPKCKTNGKNKHNIIPLHWTPADSVYKTILTRHIISRLVGTYIYDVVYRAVAVQSRHKSICIYFNLSRSLIFKNKALGVYIFTCLNCQDIFIHSTLKLYIILT